MPSVGVVVIGCSVAALAYIWWEFANSELVLDDDEDYEDWNGR